MDVLEIGGEVETPKKFDFTSLHSLPNQIENVSEVLPGKEGAAVSLQSILDHVGATGAARYITLECTDGKFSASVPLNLVRDAIILYRLDGRPLPENKGGPYRFLIPRASECHVSDVDACANVKYLGRMTFDAVRGKDTRPTNDTLHAAHHQKEGHEHLT